MLVPTPAVQRVLDAAARKGVELHVVSFEQSTRTAAEAAGAVGAEVGQIVKSLVFVMPGDEGLQPCLALVSGANTVDLSRLAAVVSAPHVRRATADEARRLTGFAIGGIPPFGHDQPIRTVMDPDLGRFQTVWAAAGAPNSVFEVAPGALRMLANAVVAPVAADTADSAPVGAEPAAAAADGARADSRAATIGQ